MLDSFIEMINQADMLSGYEKKDDKITLYGEVIDVVVVTVPTSEHDYIEAIFHKGTETLIDINVRHQCTCGHHH